MNFPKSAAAFASRVSTLSSIPASPYALCQATFSGC
nr:MAG TPA_asm: hypothetical protein [Caudoviricetes sp.]